MELHHQAATVNLFLRDSLAVIKNNFQKRMGARFTYRSLALLFYDSEAQLDVDVTEEMKQSTILQLREAPLMKLRER